MISLHRLSDLSSIQDLKSAYLGTLDAPLDGMWEVLANEGSHWEVRMDGQRVGYFAADKEGTLLQFYVTPSFEDQARRVFDHVVAQGFLSKVLVSTGDPLLFGLVSEALDGASVHSYLYELSTVVEADHPKADGANFRPVNSDELEKVVLFQQGCLASEEDMTDWLRGYSGNLIRRKELYLLCRGIDWIGLGECRLSDSQEGIADLGMMVAKAHRRNGWASYILARLAAKASATGRLAICSTTVENIAAQKAITNAGFVSRHRMLVVELTN